MATPKNHQSLAAVKEKVQFWGSNSIVQETNPRAPGLKEYTVADLKIASNNFGTLMGKGDFGNVYKGWVDEKTLAPSKSQIGMAVAVKISTYSNGDSQVLDHWQNEINFSGRHYHPNLISLLGYCWERNTIALVYEFMQKGNLWSHLFQSYGTMKPLSWDMRLKIAIEAGQVLAFLHNLEKKVIHTDFKSSNILLDKNYNVKLAGFSFAIRGPHDEDLPVTSTILATCHTRIIDTFGYYAPKYILTGKVYIKSDVYSFGVVLLELLTGLKSIDDNRPYGEENLVHWLEPKLSNEINLETVMDVHMEGQYSIKAAFQAAELTKKCLDLNPANRPNMRQVVEVLKQIEAMEEDMKKSKN